MGNQYGCRNVGGQHYPKSILGSDPVMCCSIQTVGFQHQTSAGPGWQNAAGSDLPSRDHESHRKAVFPVTGLGTLPAAKAMPKEMLPVVDRRDSARRGPGQRGGDRAFHLRHRPARPSSNHFAGSSSWSALTDRRRDVLTSLRIPGPARRALPASSCRSGWGMRCGARVSSSGMSPSRFSCRMCWCSTIQAVSRR